MFVVIDGSGTVWGPFRSRKAGEQFIIDRGDDDYYTVEEIRSPVEAFCWEYIA